MPVYEYACNACGIFSESRPMSASGQPALCPSCASQAPRVLSVTAARPGRARRVGEQRDRPEPRLVRSDREPPKPRVVAPRGGRPWMMGH